MNHAVRRRWVAAAMVAAALLCAGVGWVGAQFTRSPAQVAADSQPPPPTLITAPVELRGIRDTIVTRGTVSPAGVIEAGVRAPTSGESIITAVHVAVGDEVSLGKVLVEIAGRPVFVIAGSTPVYRNLTPGTHGPDVKQLQTSLRDMGFTVEPDGVYGATTASAVAAWYERAGFDAAPAGPDDSKRLEAAQDLVRSAGRALEDAKTGAAAAPDQPTAQTAFARAKEDFAKAQASLSDVRAKTGASVPAAELITVSSLPATVRKVGLKPADTVGAGTITLSTGGLAVRARLPVAQQGLVRPTQPVELVAEALGKTAKGKIGELLAGQQQDSKSTASPQEPGFSVIPDEPLPREWNGQDVRVTVVAASSAGDVLVVPLAAVSADAGGRNRVIVSGGEDKRTTVEVTTGIVGEGYVQVTPVSGTLDAGQRVIVGEIAKAKAQ